MIFFILEQWNCGLVITGINSIFTYMKIKPVTLNCNNSSQYFCFYCFIDQINGALECINTFIQIYLDINCIYKIAIITIIWPVAFIFIYYSFFLSIV